MPAGHQSGHMSFLPNNQQQLCCRLIFPFQPASFQISLLIFIEHACVKGICGYSPEYQVNVLKKIIPEITLKNISMAGINLVAGIPLSVPASS